MNNQGIKIGNAVYGLRNSNNNFTFVVINNPSGEFLPCGDHPGSESFDDCFAREWDDFLLGYDWLCYTSYTSNCCSNFNRYSLHNLWLINIFL
jgi:hypothetical protein